MKKLFTLIVSIMMLPFAFAVSTGVGIGIGVSPTNSVPEIWMNTGTYDLLDMFSSPITRVNNYAFTGERLYWDVVVRDLDGIEDIATVQGTVGAMEGLGNPVEVNCVIGTQPSTGTVLAWANGISFDPITDRVYECTLVVEPGMVGEYYAQIVVTDDSSNQDSIDEDSFFYFNPSIGLSISNAPSGLDFGTVTPGDTSYSQTIALHNEVAPGSGVVLDVRIKGTDFYDSASSAARCPTTNQLELGNFRYFATKGSYSTALSGTADAEGYDEIGYTFSKIIKGSGAQASRIGEGGDMAITFKLNLPSPCTGNFDSGEIIFEGEAV